MWAEAISNASREVSISDAAILPRGGPNKLEQGENFVMQIMIIAACS
jgi:hypothetical protein